MGFESFKAMLPDLGTLYDLVILLRDSEKNRKLFAPYADTKGLTIRCMNRMNCGSIRKKSRKLMNETQMPLFDSYVFCKHDKLITLAKCQCGRLPIFNFVRA